MVAREKARWSACCWRGRPRWPGRRPWPGRGPGRGRATPAGATTPRPSTRRPSPPPTRGRSTTARHSTQSKSTLVESGDAGPASASQTVTMGTGSISILVIGGITYVKGNADGLENLAGLSSPQAAEAAGQWIEFSTDNAAFAPVVQGVRSTDVAKELALKAPLSLGHPRTLDGYAVDAIDGTQTFGAEVRARRPLRPRPGDPRSRGGGLGERQGKTDRRRARHLLQMGRARAPRGPHGHRLRRARSAPSKKGGRPTSSGPGGVRRCPSPPLAEPALVAPPCRASRRVKVMRPLRQNPIRIAAVAAGLTASTALALALAAAGRRRQHDDHDRSSQRRDRGVQGRLEGRRQPGRALLLRRQAERGRARRQR